jgi:pimeloyl-ACP methyl ester carboxylesterase
MTSCPPEVTLGDFTACNAFDVMDQLDKIKIPVLVMTASEDQMTPIKYGQFLAGRIENSAISNIEDAGHLSPVEKPDEVAKAITDFLAAI